MEKEITLPYFLLELYYALEIRLLVVIHPLPNSTAACLNALIWSPPDERSIDNSLISVVIPMLPFL